MSVSVDICNSALIKLGAERINALTDDNKRARLCQEQYSKIVNRVLRSHLWTFAIKRTTLSSITNPFEFGEEVVFELPLDCIRVVGIKSNVPRKYKIEQRYLVWDGDETCNLFYIAKNIPEAYYDENFKEALACALAADLCYAITQSNTLKQSLVEECEYWTSQARSFNSQEISPEAYQFDEWENSRKSGLGGLYYE